MRPEKCSIPEHPNFKDITGSRYARLTVLYYAGRETHTKTKTHIWLCRCKCGNEIVARASNLRSGNTKSCGCMHSGGRAIERHGMHDTPTYQSWEHMINRCNPNYFKRHLYADRGITVCERWRSFKNFLADMGERPDGDKRYTIDRVDPDKDYEPGNCRWATHKQQVHNQRYIGNQYGKWKIGGGPAE